MGGGLIGRCLAWRASRSGARVVLHDLADSQGMNSAAWAAAGMIAPATEAIDADAQISSMGINSVRLWPRWLAELPIPVFYRDTGTLLLWHAEDTGEAARAQSMVIVQIIDNGTGLEDTEKIFDAFVTTKEKTLALNVDLVNLPCRRRFTG
nr:FAD-dependent oxidoreductase [Edaphobacter aggregans]